MPLDYVYTRVHTESFGPGTDSAWVLTGGVVPCISLPRLDTSCTFGPSGVWASWVRDAPSKATVTKTYRVEPMNVYPSFDWYFINPNCDHKNSLVINNEFRKCLINPFRTWHIIWYCIKLKHLTTKQKALILPRRPMVKFRRLIFGKSQFSDDRKRN